MGPASKFAMDFFCFLTKQALPNPLIKQKGMWIPFPLSMSEPGGNGEGEPWACPCESLGACGAAEVCDSHLCHSNIISYTPWAQTFWFFPVSAHALCCPSHPCSRWWDLWRGGVGCFAGSHAAIYLCTAPDLSALSPRPFSPGVYNRTVTPPEGEGTVQSDPPLQLLFLLLSNSSVGRSN